VQPAELFQQAEAESRRLPPPPPPLDAAIERLRSECAAFFDLVPEPPVYRRADDPTRVLAQSLTARGEGLLARALSLERQPGGALLEPFVHALKAHLEQLCHIADGRIEAAEASWRSAAELERRALSARRAWARTDEALPPVFDPRSRLSRYDPRPEPAINVKLACPADGCRKIADYALSTRHAHHSFTCTGCGKPFTVYVGEVRSLELEPRNGGSRRYLFRIDDLSGEATRVEVIDAGPGELSAARRDLIAFLYADGRNLRGVLNLSSSRLLWLRRGGPCFLATAAFGEGAPQLETFRLFRDRVLLSHRLGVAAVAVYYRVGPMLAGPVARRPGLKRAVKKVLGALERSLWRAMQRGDT
jgi:hypothetical protein